MGFLGGCGQDPHSVRAPGVCGIDDPQVRIAAFHPCEDFPHVLAVSYLGPDCVPDPQVRENLFRILPGGDTPGLPHGQAFDGISGCVGEACDGQRGLQGGDQHQPVPQQGPDGGRVHQLLVRQSLDAGLVGRYEHVHRGSLFDLLLKGSGAAVGDRQRPVGIRLTVEGLNLRHGVLEAGRCGDGQPGLGGLAAAHQQQGGCCSEQQDGDRCSETLHHGLLGVIVIHYKT